MNISKAINAALCSIDSKLSGLYEKWDKELQGVDASVKSVPISDAMPIEMARRNPASVEVWVCNVSDKDLMLGPATANINRNLFSVIVAPKDTIIINAHNYAHLFKQGFDGFWEENAAADSKAMITDFYLKN